MKWNDTFLDAQRLACDPPADAVIDRLVAEFGPEKARELFTVLINNIDIGPTQVPDYVMAYLTQQGTPPAEIDNARVVRGQKVFLDHGPAMALMLFFKSLPTTYLDWRGVEILAITGRLDDTRTWPTVFSRRVGETTQFLLDVMNPGSLRPGGTGIYAILKVRLVHASIRYFISRSSKYNEAVSHKPINQEDLAYTLLTFSLVMLQGMKQMNLKVTDQQADDFHYAWKLVGHYLGIAPEMIPDNLADAEDQQKAMFKRLVGSSEAGKSVTKALIDFSNEMMLTSDMLGNSSEFMLRYFMGDEHAAILGIEPKKGCLAAILPNVIARFLGLVEKLEDGGLGLERLGNKMGLALLRAFKKRFKSTKGRSLYIPAEVEKEWGI